MFFQHLLLYRQNGGFTLPWVAATRGIKQLNRKQREQVGEVNIVKLVKEIEKFVQSHSTDATKRFSLRTSSYLIHGTVKIYSEQVSRLYAEISVAVEKIYSRPSIDLDQFQIPLEYEHIMEGAVGIDIMEGAVGIESEIRDFPAIRPRVVRQKKPRKPKVVPPLPETPEFELDHLLKDLKDRLAGNVVTADESLITLREDVPYPLPQDPQLFDVGEFDPIIRLDEEIVLEPIIQRPEQAEQVFPERNQLVVTAEIHYEPPSKRRRLETDDVARELIPPERIQSPPIIVAPQIASRPEDDAIVRLEDLIVPAVEIIAPNGEAILPVEDVVRPTLPEAAFEVISTAPELEVTRKRPASIRKPVSPQVEDLDIIPKKFRIKFRRRTRQVYLNRTYVQFSPTEEPVFRGIYDVPREEGCDAKFYYTDFFVETIQAEDLQIPDFEPGRDSQPSLRASVEGQRSKVSARKSTPAPSEGPSVLGRPVEEILLPSEPAAPSVQPEQLQPEFDAFQAYLQPETHMTPIEHPPLEAEIQLEDVSEKRTSSEEKSASPMETEVTRPKPPEHHVLNKRQQGIIKLVSEWDYSKDLALKDLVSDLSKKRLIARAFSDLLVLAQEDYVEIINDENGMLIRIEKGKKLDA